MAIDLEKKYRPYVVIASIVVPIVVAALFGVKIDGYDTSFLPPIYAGINGLTAIVLIAAVLAIKKGNRKLHQKLINVAIGCSILFLLGYITYHVTSDTTYYGDLNHDHVMSESEQDAIRSSAMIYYFILVSHIMLSIMVIPMVMMTYLKGWSRNLDSHKKWAKITFPIWLYVAISGVVVYLMISPYYA